MVLLRTGETESHETEHAAREAEAADGAGDDHVRDVSVSRLRDGVHDQWLLMLGLLRRRRRHRHCRHYASLRPSNDSGLTTQPNTVTCSHRARTRIVCVLNKSRILKTPTTFKNKIQ